jgi:hypothetical protein
MLKTAGFSFFFKQNNTQIKGNNLAKPFMPSFAALFLPAAKVDYDNIAGKKCSKPIPL